MCADKIHVCKEKPKNFLRHARETLNGKTPKGFHKLQNKVVKNL